jgi:hypothetical protein
MWNPMLTEKIEPFEKKRSVPSDLKKDKGKQHSSNPTKEWVQGKVEEPFCKRTRVQELLQKIIDIEMVSHSLLSLLL